ncbi:hypothetical protein [Enterococcus casseliflavus]|uniref:hypothetical protein n=1 Tax=Enterococcus casseliflavus TaxID=37734 RepID=UPI003017EEE0
MTNKQAYLNFLGEMIADEEINLTDNAKEAIFYTEEYGLISGDFDLGLRGTDHEVLKDDSFTWLDIMNAGTLIVPESKTYISNTNIEFLDLIGYEKMPFDNNHFVGYKG